MGHKGKFVVNKVDKCNNIHTNNAAPPNTTRHQPSKLTLTQKLEFILTLINRLLIGFITIYLCWMSLRLNKNDIPWHAVLCTLGFVVLMSEGLMAYYRGNVWTQLCYRPERTRLHWILQLCGSVIGMTGIIVKICIEEIHFHTRHGIIGLVTMVILLFSLLSGLTSLYANELKHRFRPRFNKTIHNLLGLITFTLAMISMYYSFETELFNDYSLDASTYMDFRLLLEISIILIFVLSCYGPVWCMIYSRV